MNITPNTGPVSSGAATGAQSHPGAAVATERREHRQDQAAFDEDGLGWTRCGEAVLPIAAPLAALAILLTWLIA